MKVRRREFRAMTTLRDVAGELSGGGVRPRSGIDTAKTRLSSLGKDSLYQEPR